MIDTGKERIDELNIKGYRIIQNADLFCFGLDAVLLTGFAKVKKTDRVIDLCSGTGIIPFLMLARDDVQKVTCLEYFEYFCSLIKKTAELNGCEDRIDIVNADLKDTARLFKKSEFDVLTVNPPYEKNGHGIDCDNEIKNAARRETLCDLSDVVKAAHHLLKTGGRLYMVHKAARLCDIFCTLRENGFEPRELQMVQSKKDSVPHLCLVSAIKGAPPYLKVLKTLTIYNDDGSYTEESSRVYTIE